MKIAVVCANGRAGQLIVQEALNRGLDVTAIARGENRTAAAQYVRKDLFDLTAADMAAYDVVVDAFGAWAEAELPNHTKSLMHLCDILSGTDKRLLVVGGALAPVGVLAALAGEAMDRVLPWLTLPLTTLLEVTTGTYQIASLPLPLPLRAAIIAGATGFGGLAVILQNRAVWPRGLLSLPEQLLWQAVHGGASFLITLGLMLLLA